MCIMTIRQGEMDLLIVATVEQCTNKNIACHNRHYKDNNPYGSSSNDK